MSDATLAAGPRTLRSGAWRLECHEELPSTSDLCIARARAGEADGLAIMAGRQTSGRGSQGRHWFSPRGNLYLSLMMRPDEPAACAGQWALLAGVALAEAAEAFMPAGAPLALKWPNDLLLDGRKLAGILVDSAATAAGRVDWVVLGIGVNLAAAPAVPDRPTAAFAEIARPPAPLAFAERLLARIAAWRERRAAAGFAPLQEAWLARAQPPGTKLLVRTAHGVLEGAFAGLSPDGALLLATGGAVRVLASAELLPGAPLRAGV